MITIQSKTNQRFKIWKKLTTNKGRQKAKQYIIEGWHLLEEAIITMQKIDVIITSLDNYQQVQQLIGNQAIEIEVLADHLIDDLAETLTSQGVFAVLSLTQDLSLKRPLGSRILLVDQVQDPGNLGTMIRTADAAGFDSVILGTGCVDLYNDKVLRATQGSLWHLNVYQSDLFEAIDYLQADGFKVYATALNTNAKDYREVSAEKIGLIVGNEGQGVNPQLFPLVNELIFIPMSGQAESLNVAIASAILMFHYKE